ncbi:transporter [[Clostridium] cellulosi]|uniref:Transporter n=1 Tax=[Clostridium] cellulosi TaxID=29343 RepID=A0A078KSH6_9FIRM|nr:transporter [[Clostridium] cellulosi]
MLTCVAFERCNLLTSLAGLSLGKFSTPRMLGFAMISVTGLLSMFVTNDVALLTVVPLTLSMSKVSGKDPYILIILETIAANIFSALTPFGNPQNLYLFSYFKLEPLQFFLIMLPFCLIGIAILFAANFLFNSGGKFKTEKIKFEVYEPRLLYSAAVVFIFNILSVLHVLDYRIALAATLIIFLIFAPRLILKADYFLLMTFVLFFLFTDSVTGISMIKSFFSSALNAKYTVLIAATGLSQIISNVPSAVLISGFTENHKELLYGVSAGGLGTLVASLASLISYKLYIRQYDASKYIKAFSALNFGALAIILIFLCLFCI